ncbi:MAG: DEAD/DEAH box helicase family protein [Verrucomicrobia bacterium]|nr:DEAD/DEAH box helicase family protein [Verrucomicrobiota bacterium]
MKCSACPNRALLPLSDAVIRSHILGQDTQIHKRDFVVGIYPLLTDETCWFLALDFDRSTWAEDVGAFREVCESSNLPVAIERSRSGKGAHAWIFLTEAMPAGLVRRLGAALLTEAMERRPEIGLGSYDRMFPNQDTMPKGGFGNLIALPFQRKAVAQKNTLFVDANMEPYRDQWGYLASLPRIGRAQVESAVEAAATRGGIIGVRMVAIDEDDDDPWTAPPSRRPKELPLEGNLPASVQVTLANEIYVAKSGMSPALVNRIIRLAAFQNPEFYRNQAMRLPTYATPRVVGCAENSPKYIGLPIGCLDDLLQLLKQLGVKAELKDERVNGTPLAVTFAGKLRPDQKLAAQALLRHNNGVLAATTAFGKTVVAIFLLAQRGVNTLILVHRKQLMDQWVSRLATFLNLAESAIGRIGSGKSKANGRIDVAMIQSLCRKGVVNDLVGQYGHLIVDECHHISAPSFEQVARRCKARFITGLSATVVRKDGHHPIIIMQCGPIRFRADSRHEALKRPFEHRVIIRHTALTIPNADALAVHDLYAAIVRDEARNAQIIQDALSAVAEGRSPVILTERREHVEVLAQQLAGRVEHLVILRGGMGTRQRKQAAEQIAAIPPGSARIILATGKYLGEGFDDARLDTLLLAMPISWRGTLAQYAGRLHRERDGKTSVVIYDYADVKIPMLDRMLRRRLRGYDAIGYRRDGPDTRRLPLWNDREGSVIQADAQPFIH